MNPYRKALFVGPTLLLDWLRTRIPAEGLAWLEEKAALLGTGAPDKTLFASFSSALRHAGKAPLNLSAQDLDAARKAVPEWDPSDWTCDQAARIFLLLSLPPGRVSETARSSRCICSAVSLAMSASDLR